MTARPDAAARRRSVAATTLVGTGLLGTSLSTRPGSRQFYGLTLAAAGAWAVGGFAARRAARREGVRGRAEDTRAVVVPMLIGAGAFGVFYGCALVARHVPVLDQAITEVFKYDRQGSSSWVLFTTLANGAAEEAFFRGAVYDEFAGRRPVLGSTAVYAAVVTASTRNPALILASTVMGTLFAAQRCSSGGIRASTITHLTWSTLMLHYLPPLFRPAPALPGTKSDGRSA